MSGSEPFVSGKEARVAPSVSVIIPTYHPDSKLGDCIDSIIESGRTLDFDIWIVDSSDNEIEPLIGDRLNHERLHIIKSSRRLFPGEARDIGVRASGGEVLVFTDSDCVVARDWLPALKRGLIECGCEVCGGSVENGTPGSYFGTAEYLSEFGIFTPRNRSRPERFIPTCNMAIYRSAYLEAGGFPHDQQKGSDVAFGKRLQDLGKGVFFRNDAVVIHRNRTGCLAFVKNQYRLGAGFAVNLVRGNQPLSSSRLMKRGATRPILLLGVFPGRLYRLVRRAIVNSEVSVGHLLADLPALTLGAASFAAGCIIRFVALRGNEPGPEGETCP